MALHLFHRVNTDVVIKETFLKWCIIQGEKKKKEKRQQKRLPTQQIEILLVNKI